MLFLCQGTISSSAISKLRNFLHFLEESCKRLFGFYDLHVPSARGEWPSGLYSLRQVTEVKLGRVRSDSGWVTTEA